MNKHLNKRGFSLESTDIVCKSPWLWRQESQAQHSRIIITVRDSTRDVFDVSGVRNSQKNHRHASFFFASRTIDCSIFFPSLQDFSRDFFLCAHCSLLLQRHGLQEFVRLRRKTKRTRENLSFLVEAEHSFRSSHSTKSFVFDSFTLFPSKDRVFQFLVSS